jgi:dipeptidyl aminopeptidase/acylaminoacyl peptidase
MNMRICGVLLLAAPAMAHSFTLEQVMGFSFPSNLIAAPTGGKVAWVENRRGVRSIKVAEPPEYQARTITAYTADDGQEIQDLRWTPDAHGIVYVRGEDANRAGEHPNPAIDPGGVEQAVWLAPLDGGSPRRISEGNEPSISPHGDLVAFVRKGQIWTAPLDGKENPLQLLHTRGKSSMLMWSPDGSRLAFESARGDHGFIGVYDLSAKTLRYLDPSTDQDVGPEWAPDGRRIAFLRWPGGRRLLGPRRIGRPWSVRVADPESGRGHEIWRAPDGAGSVYRTVAAANLIFWGSGDRLVFPWERDGWTHLYSISADGGEPKLLTPGEFEVEDVALAPGGREVLYSSNEDDADRRHLWKVAVNGGRPTRVTSGQGLEWSPAMTSNGMLAYLRSDARSPAHPAIATGAATRALDPVPSDFPVNEMVIPQPIVFSSADGIPIHAQLFLPPARSGGRSPALVFFHGGSRRQMLLGWHYMYYYHNAYAMNQYLASQGYVVLSVNYRSGTGYGLNFREALNYGPVGGSEYNDVQGAGVYLRSRSDVDPARIGVWGGSYGGYLAAMALARASDLFAAGVDFHGVHDWSTELGMNQQEPEAKVAFQSSPMAFVKDWRSPVLLIHGDDDRNVQFGQTVILANALRKQKVDFEELIFPDEIHDFLLYSHWLEAYRAEERFFARTLRDSPRKPAQ